MASASNSAFWKGRPVYITGATGLLGSCLVEELCTRGAEVVALVRDDLRRSRFWKLAGQHSVTVVRGAVQDLSLQERVINEYEIETVFHLAAQTIVGTANRSPVSTFESNIGGTWSVLEAARRISTCRRVLFASSDKAYGAQPVLPYTESTPLQGIHPYDVSKSCADLIATSYHRSYGLPVCTVRCANLFGGGDLNFNRIVPGTVRSVLRGERPIIRSDGTLLRDYLYVREGALAYLALAEAMEDKSIHGEAFNFSNDRPLRVLEMAREILGVMDSRLELDIQNHAVNEIPEQYLDSRKARERLGWRPQIDFHQALRETVEWYRGFLAGDAAEARA